MINSSNFFRDAENNLKKIPKENEQKTFSFNIIGSKSEPKGISIDAFAFGKEVYHKYINQSNSYVNNAMFVISFSFYVNNEKSLNIIEKFFNEIKPMIDDISFFKNSNSSCNLSFLGNKIFIDIVINDEQFLKPFLDLNIDFVDFHTFKASYKTEFVPRDFFVLTFDELTEKIITISFHSYSKTIKGKYNILSLLKALRNVNKKKTIDQIISYLYLFIGFIKQKFNFEYSSKEFYQCYLKNKIKRFLNVENLD